MASTNLGKKRKLKSLLHFLGSFNFVVDSGFRVDIKTDLLLLPIRLVDVRRVVLCGKIFKKLSC